MIDASSGSVVEHLGPQRRVALERERCDAEEAEVAGEEDVGVGDEREEVARRVALGRHHLDARRQERAVGDEVGDGPRAHLREFVELRVERGHERLVRGDRHHAVEQLTRLRRSVHARVREAAGAADMVDVRVGEDDPANREAEAVDRGRERFPLRRGP